jgi:type IV secretion system protein TrbL
MPNSAITTGCSKACSPTRRTFKGRPIRIVSAAAGLLPPRFALRRRSLWFLAVAGVFIAPAALAQITPTIPSNGVMDNLANLMSSRATAWLTTAQSFARNIFYGLAAIEITWAGIEYTLRKNELGELLVSILFKLLAICFFYFVLINLAPTWVPWIIQSFTQMGSTVSGTTIAQLSPSAVFEHGIVLAGALFNRAGQGSFITEVTGVLESLPAMLILMFSFAFVALKLLITLAEADIVLAGALPMLGFLGSRWTTPWGEKYFGYAVSVGVKLMVLYLVIGLGDQIFMDEQNFFSGGTGPPTFSDMYQYALAAFLYAGVAWSVPSIAGAVMSGAPAMGIGSLMAPIATTAAGTLAATAAGSAVLHGMAARGAEGLEQLSRLTTPDALPSVSGAVGGAEKLSTMGTQTEAAGAASSGFAGADGLATLSAQARSATGETPTDPPADNPSTAASAEGQSAAPRTAGVDALSAPGSSVSNDSSNEPGDAEKSTARTKKLLRTAQEAGDRFARHASTLAAQAQNMPQTFGALSIRIRHPEG